MKRWLIILAILGGWAGLGARTALAQPGYFPPQTNPNPTLSPYLNLVPNNPYIQYFGIGQGQTNNARTIQQLQQQVANQQGYAPLGVGNTGLQPNMITTGHMVTFQNTSHYFPAPGAPFAGMGVGGGGLGGGGLGGLGGGGFGGGGFGGQQFNVNTPLNQGYAAGGYYR